MDTQRRHWYFSSMTGDQAIPVFTLFGETEHFPDVVHCEGFSARAPIHGWRISAHRHAQMAQLFLVECGKIDAVVDGHRVEIVPGSILFIPSQKVHEFVFEPDTEGRVISFPNPVIRTIGPASQEIQAVLSRWLVRQSDQLLRETADLLAQACDETGRFRPQKAVALAHALLCLIAEAALAGKHPPIAPSNLFLTRLDRLIAQHLPDGWGPSEYAASMSMSTGHLSRICRASTGHGAGAYIERAIVEEACRLLAFTQLPVSEIGYRLGYSDPSYFSKRFRAAIRKTPSEYRRQFHS